MNPLVNYNQIMSLLIFILYKIGSFVFIRLYFIWDWKFCLCSSLFYMRFNVLSLLVFILYKIGSFCLYSSLLWMIVSSSLIIILYGFESFVFADYYLVWIWKLCISWSLFCMGLKVLSWLIIILYGFESFVLADYYFVLKPKDKF